MRYPGNKDKGLLNANQVLFKVGKTVLWLCREMLGLRAGPPNLSSSQIPSYKIVFEPAYLYDFGI